MVQSPDLVSIPNQNFSWQGFNFQPQGSSNNQQSQPMSGPGDPQNVGMGVDNFNALGGIDIGMNFDELFGNLGANGINSAAGTEDWGQWTNVNM